MTKYVMLFLCVITISCSSNKYITITTQQFRGFVKYDYPEGVDIKAFEHEYERETEAYKLGMTKQIHFFKFDTLKEYGSFNRWRRFGRNLFEKCNCHINKLPQEKVNKIKKHKKYGSQEADAIVRSLFKDYCGDIEYRITTFKNEKIDTFYLGNINFFIKNRIHSYLIKDNKCYVMRNDFLYKKNKSTLFSGK